MTLENRFNLIDEPWIPVVDVGKVSLKQLFSISNYRALGGNPVQKIALTKMLLAIAQVANTPIDDADWSKLGVEGLAKSCLNYLNKWHDSFWLYGEKPFLQMLNISAAEEQIIGAVMPEVATGNTTILTETQIEKAQTDAEKALLILTLMGFGLGGKKTDNKVILSEGYQGKFNDKGKPSTSKPGVSVGFKGYLHNFLQGESLMQTIWLNLFTLEQVEQLSMYPAGIGIPPWEKMPDGENCAIAQALKNSLIGRLLPVSRFCLLSENGLHYSEGIAHPSYKEEGVVDPSVAFDFSGKERKVIWVDPEKRPWRNLSSLLRFMSQSNSNGFDCFQIKFCLTRARKHSQVIGLWSGGLKVRINAGEQYPSGNDDFVESNILLKSNLIGQPWYEQLRLEMNELDGLSKVVYSKTLGFYKSQKMEGEKQARKASSLFWQLCERKFQALLNSCIDINETKKMRKIFARCVDQAYATFCPQNTARQLDAWAENKPNLKKYLS
jgi:CRISPR system Cascade subunit CasA